MLPKQYGKLPADMQNEAVKPYFEALNKKRKYLAVKRAFDIVFSVLVLAVLAVPMLLTALAVKLSSKGPVFYRQTRVGALGREFKIIKFRTMVINADRMGARITIGDDTGRVTKLGRILRKLKVDELPQFINVIKGDMTIVGTRPEVPEYVARYTDEMKATLLLRPGIVNKASIVFSNESAILGRVHSPERYYIHNILPEKMRYNLDYILDSSLLLDLGTMFCTVGCILGLVETKELPEPAAKYLAPAYVAQQPQPARAS